MKLSKTFLPVASALFVASAANAQVMTEVCVSTSGVDREFVEILGTPGQSTDGLMLLVVEGDPGGSTGGAGNLDQAYDLSGNFFGATDTYFVVGSAEADAAFGTGVIDFLPAGDNLFENSSLTLYLVNVPDATLRSDITTIWNGTDITDPVGSMTTTRIATDPGVTILDAVGIWDGDVGDLFFDNAPVFGPDGNFLPPGVFRNGGCPGDWCTDFFLNFGSVAAAGIYVDETPGAVNPTTTCGTQGSAGTCGGFGGLGVNYCMANANSTGVAGALGAVGSTTVATNDVTLTASSLPTTAFGFFIVSRDQGFAMNPGGSSGNLCLSGSVGRYVGPGQIKNSGVTGMFSLTIDLSAIPSPTGPVATIAGDTWNFQTWFRDSVGGSATSNFTQGLSITFQ
ncbi:hypothetical protein Poly30_36020 [Planctomycetes bacterium Poly30]|uniref:Uncharacterized protein n=1 Tax=Saltatorellus ferox TaxID=2528018 RepID=A0A518EVD9_9BACT|nr:hypothetical protein Poly30_36020 [Planctomycetes bacterium Poly30]